MRKTRQGSILIALLAAGLLGLSVVAVMTSIGPPATKPALIGGPFTLTAADGHTVTDTDLRGHPFLVFFGYTHCPDTCPTTLLELSRVLKAMRPGAQMKVLFITVDPARDTASVMKAYLANFDPHIIGLTGTEQQIRAVERAYRVYAKKVPEPGGDYAMDHTAIVYLMDRNGQFVSAFNLDRAPNLAAAELEKYL